MWSDWLVVCDCGFSLSALWCPLSAPIVLFGFLLPWTWGISSWLPQQSAVAAPYLGRGVAPLSHCPWPLDPLDCSEIQSVHPKGNQSWVFIGRTDVEAETLMFWPPDVMSWLIWKDPDVWKDWSLEEKGMTEDEMVRWHHRLNGHEFGWIPGAGDGQGGLACCGSWGHKELDTTEWLNWIESGRVSWAHLCLLIGFTQRKN